MKHSLIVLLTSLAIISTAHAEDFILDKTKSKLLVSAIPGFFEVRQNPDSGNYIIFDARKITSIEVKNNESEDTTVYYDGVKYDKIVIPNRLMRGDGELQVISRALASIYN